MISEIKFSSVANVPSDYAAPDGQLALAVNAICENNEIHALPASKTLLGFSPLNQRLVLLHNIPGGHQNLIFMSTAPDTRGALSYIDASQLPAASNAQFTDMGCSVPADSRFTALGNTICAYSPSGNNYILWQRTTADSLSYQYTPLYSHIPELPISFSLYVGAIDTGLANLSYPGSMGQSMTLDFGCQYSSSQYSDDDTQLSIQNQVCAAVNKFIADTHDSGRFIFPFFACAAYRLFDGSYIMNTEPVLLMPSARIAPMLAISGFSDSCSSVTIQPFAFPAQLSAHTNATSQQLTSLLEPYRNVISSIDIFISAPIYTYAQAGCDPADQKMTVQSSSAALDKCFGIFSDGARSFRLISDGYCMTPPQRSVADISADFSSCADFYLAKSIPFEQFYQQGLNGDITPPSGLISTIRTRKRLPDDYDSHDTLASASAFAYNSRLHLANITKAIYHGGRFSRVCPFGTGAGSANTTYTFTLFWHVNAGGHTQIHSTAPDSRDKARDINPWIYYPSTNAFRIVIRRHNNSTGANDYMSADLRAHDFLNGAYWMPDESRLFPSCSRDGYTSADWFIPDPSITADPETTDDTVSLPNKLYQSDVSNLFSFPLAGISTVSSGAILGISAAAKPLSQGQFGQFPFYVFTDQGVWSMSVADDGTLRPAQIITADVCSSPESITQLDQTVVYPTARGLMSLSGSSASLLSQAIDSLETFSLSSLPGHVTLANSATVSSTAFDLPALSDYLDGCGIAYDYPHQHVYLFNPAYRFSYVLSLRSGNWALAPKSIASAIPSFPNAVIVNAYGQVEDLALGSIAANRALIVSRPLSFDAPDILKTVSFVAVRGSFPPGSVACALYGSRNLANWHLIGSSNDNFLRGLRGSPYKYFRLAIVADNGPRIAISSATIQYNQRMTNHLR